MVRDVVQESELQGANGILNLVRNFSSILALGVSGALVALVGPGYALAIDSMTFAISAMLISRIVPKQDSRILRRMSLLAQLNGPLRIA